MIESLITKVALSHEYLKILLMSIDFNFVNAEILYNAEIKSEFHLSLEVWPFLVFCAR